MENDMFPRTEYDTPAKSTILATAFKRRLIQYFLPATVFERRLIRYLLLYPILLMACAVAEVVVFRQGVAYTAWLRYAGSPVVAAIFICIALRHYRISRRFLKIFVVVTFLGTILGGGFYYCATLSHNGSLVDTAMVGVHKDTNFLRSIFWPGSITNLFGLMTAQPSPAVRWLGAYSNSLLSFPYSYLVVYGNMVGPYFLLLMFLAPPFLAFPIFWLWMVLNILYIFVPQRAWGWIKDKAKLSWKRIFASKS
ncbi:hypothetical protein [Candidatus Cryosericum terrychapinii]|jgi:hypothetical protein|uniref:Uncharacterized protein n=1 Tax=Candidatus Cryosericum terrychapinii TaxID=2290919 RepID=A0A398CTR9_9BACT|nr:hypothetical protein [Candidatus Cryosericum terrychapinii]RIE05500.1 hypothetical protein SMC7_07125 [Candidatus Cryosericum terrychapinii]